MSALIADVLVETRIVAHTCGECGVVFGLGAEYIKQRVADRRTWYCPNGHPRVFTGKHEAENLREQLKWARSSADSWRDQAETAERRRRAEKAAKTRLKNRVANGVCPCCKRSFPALQQHMATEHPDYSEAVS